MKKEILIILGVALLFGVWGLAMSADYDDHRMMKKCHLSQYERDRVVTWMNGGK